MSIGVLAALAALCPASMFAATLTGRIVDAKTGEPVAKAEVIATGTGQRVRTDDAMDLVKLFVVRPVDQHPRCAVTAAPYDNGAIGGVTEVQPLQRLGPFTLGRDDRSRTPREAPAR
jgi:hypothetical protein